MQTMQVSQLHYLPLTLPFFSILAGVFLVLVIMVQINALQFAYMRLGMSARSALFLLLASLLGSYINIPVAELGLQGYVGLALGVEHRLVVVLLQHLLDSRYEQP